MCRGILCDIAQGGHASSNHDVAVLVAQLVDLCRDVVQCLCLKRAVLFAHESVGILGFFCVNSVHNLGPPLDRRPWIARL
jgi:hypothetical protein